MQSEAFPIYAVRQTFVEKQIDRKDDIVIAHMQDILLSRLLTVLVKGVLVSCALARRKYINAKDIEYASNICIIGNSDITSRERGYLLDTRMFGKLLDEHIRVVSENMRKLKIIDTENVRISSDFILLFQEEVENKIRAFMDYYAKEGCKTHNYGFKLFERCSLQLFGDMDEDCAFETV